MHGRRISIRKISRAAVCAAKRAAERDSGLQQGVADAELAGARAREKLTSTVVDLDIPEATSHSPRPAAYWQHREYTEAVAAADRAAEETGRLWARFEVASATLEAAKIAHERARCRLYAYSSRDEASPLYIFSEASSRRGEQAKRALDAMMAAADAADAVGREYIGTYELSMQLHTCAHGKHDVPPQALSAEQQTELLVEWSVDAIADRSASRILIYGGMHPS